MRIYPFDLQTHSTFSDGDHSPEEIFLYAKTLGMKGLVITDHNTVAHLDTSKKSASKYQMKTIEGIEISTSFQNPDIHVLGYALRFNSTILHKGLHDTIKSSDERLKTMATKLSQLGYGVDFESIKKKKGPRGLVFKYDLIKEVAHQGHISIRKATKLMERGGSAYVPYNEKLMTPEQAVRLIVNAGGVPFLAHPVDKKRSKMKSSEIRMFLENLIKQLITVGLKGIEVRSSHHTLADVRYLKTITKKYNLIESGGSDWHGEFFKPDITLGSSGLTEKEFDSFLKKISLQKKAPLQ